MISCYIRIDQRPRKNLLAVLSIFSKFIIFVSLSRAWIIVIGCLIAPNAVQTISKAMMVPIPIYPLLLEIVVGAPITGGCCNIVPRSNILSSGDRGIPPYERRGPLFWMFLVLSVAFLPLLALFPMLLSGFLSLNRAQLELFARAKMPKHRYVVIGM